MKQFVRVCCGCHQYHDFALLTWFPRPSYPDSGPLTVPDVNNMVAVDVIGLYDIEPAKVAVELDPRHSCMYMLRLEGTDTM